MRVQLFGLLLAAFCFAPISGCDDDSGSGNHNDLSMTLDMAKGKDAAAMGTENCGAILQCAIPCANTPATAAACVAACEAKGTTAAQTAFTAIGACAFAQCIGSTDLGAETHACTGQTDTSPGCLTCVGTTAQDPTLCGTQQATCIAQMN